MLVYDISIINDPKIIFKKKFTIPHQYNSDIEIGQPTKIITDANEKMAYIAAKQAGLYVININDPS
jgi:hypothetical protein